MKSRASMGVAAVLLVAIVAACDPGPPPTAPLVPAPTTELSDLPGEVTDRPSRTPTGRPASATRPPSPSATAFSEMYAVSCAGRPTGEQVIAVVRRQASLLPAGVNLTVKSGPTCAGTWQYTVLQVPDAEPLQVVTRGAPTALTFVTAGTNPCTVEVRAGAPAGLRDAMAC